MNQNQKKRNVTLLLVTLTGITMTIRSESKWMHPDGDEPVQRLIANTEQYIKQNPKDAQGYYTLGRLHSLAFAYGMKNVTYYKRIAKNPSLPDFPSFQSLRVVREKTEKFTAEARTHLQESVRNYYRATQLSKDNALSLLGLGWMYEQCFLLGKEAGPPPKTSPAVKSDWRALALATYRQAFKQSVEKDKVGSGMMQEDIVSLEAGEGITRLQKGRNLNAAEKSELASLQAAIKIIQARPRAITPIVFPVRGNVPLRRLLATSRTVPFDLAGDDIKRRWPWVTPDTGFLVWDPQHTGRITSGRQLFGSATWWMFWKDGYQPLAALDNNHDGRLSGSELNGIAVWQDRNGNGVSEPGEVIPVRQFGVTRIAVKAAGRQEGVLANPQGIQMANGAFLPTYDWTPTSQASSLARRTR